MEVFDQKPVGASDKNKAGFPREMEEIVSRRDYFRRIMEAHKEAWSEEYDYWKERGWLT